MIVISLCSESHVVRALVVGPIGQHHPGHKEIIMILSFFYIFIMIKMMTINDFIISLIQATKINIMIWNFFLHDLYHFDHGKHDSHNGNNYDSYYNFYDDDGDCDDYGPDNDVDVSISTDWMLMMK